MNDNCGVYEIVNTVNGHRYVGSSRNLYYRKFAHFGGLRRGEHRNQPLQRAYAKYGPDAFEFRVLAFCAEDECVEREQEFIDTLKPEYNVCKFAYSNAGIKASEETRQKMSKAQTGRKQTEEAKRKVSEAQRGKPESEEAKRKHSLSQRGRVTWMKGKQHTDEANQKNRDAHLGRKASSETKAKMSAVRTGRVASEETKRKLSEARKGTHPTDETRRKLSEASKAGWAKKKAAQALGAKQGIAGNE